VHRERPRAQRGPFAIVGVNSDPDAKMIRRVVREEQITWRSFTDFRVRNGKLARISEEWNVTGWPTVFLIDHRGVIRARDPGGEKEIEALLEKLVAEAEAEKGKREGK
jgi:hypothetical protein